MANTYYNAVRSHVDLLLSRGRTDKLIAWQAGSDEVHDPTLIAYRAYGGRDFADIVMTCAGTNRIGEPLPKHIIYLPLATSLIRLRQQYGVA